MPQFSLWQYVCFRRCGALILTTLIVMNLSTVQAARNFRLPFSFASQDPHPAVARINVAEQGATSHGTGTLIHVAGQHGLVVTNWHVVRDAVGEIQIEFPDGFRSGARILKIDPDWDLAALQIWRPKVEPLPLAKVAPRPGDTLAIAGYGSGQYRSVAGRCTQYVAPAANLPYEMVELSAEARQGDSGGPIFNERGEIAGVLFGASRGTTSGSYCGRVRVFLASVVAGSTTPAPPLAAAAPNMVSRPVFENGVPLSPDVSPGTSVPGGTNLVPLPPSPPIVEQAPLGSLDPYGQLPGSTPATDLSPPLDSSSLTAPVVRQGTPIGGFAWSGALDEQAPLTSPVEPTPSAAPWEQVVGQTPFEQGKSLLAGIGILAILLRLTSVLAGGRHD